MTETYLALVPQASGPTPSAESRRALGACVTVQGSRHWTESERVPGLIIEASRWDVISAEARPGHSNILVTCFI